MPVTKEPHRSRVASRAAMSVLDAVRCAHQHPTFTRASLRQLAVAIQHFLYRFRRDLDFHAGTFFLQHQERA